MVDRHPEWRKNAIAFTNKYISEGLRDRALTRDLEWGIPVPKEGYENKTIYIWAENVLGYLSASEVAVKKACATAPSEISVELPTDVAAPSGTSVELPTDVAAPSGTSVELPTDVAAPSGISVELPTDVAAPSADEAARRAREEYASLWDSEDPESIHYYVHGKDNIPFHTIILPALLIANGDGWRLPDRIISSEFPVNIALSRAERFPPAATTPFG